MSVANWIKSIVLCRLLNRHEWDRQQAQRFCVRCGCEEWLFYRRNPMSEEAALYWRRMPTYLWSGNLKRISAPKGGCMSAVGDNAGPSEMTGGKDPRPERGDRFCHDKKCPQTSNIQNTEVCNDD